MAPNLTPLIGVIARFYSILCHLASGFAKKLSAVDVPVRYSSVPPHREPLTTADRSAVLQKEKKTETLPPIRCRTIQLSLQSVPTSIITLFSSESHSTSCTTTRSLNSFFRSHSRSCIVIPYTEVHPPPQRESALSLSLLVCSRAINTRESARCGRVGTDPPLCNSPSTKCEDP